MRSAFFKGIAAAAIAGAAFFTTAAPAKAQAEPFIGQIAIVGFNFCPRGWAQANGQLLAIAQNTALFSLLGTTYGGDGRTTFALPDLRGRSVLNVGAGPGLANVNWGQRGGQENVTLNVLNMPSHSHTVTGNMNAVSGTASTVVPTNNALGIAPSNLYASGAPSIPMAAGTITATAQNTGGNQSFNIRDPYLGMYVCIATQGIFPSRN